MYRFVVIDTNKYTRLVALRDPAGRHHVAHCTSDLPPTACELDGELPSVGFALLIGHEGKAYRLVFSQINCSQRWVQRLLHPEQVVLAPYQLASLPPVAHPSPA
jgi:hypothetical protein